MAVFWVVAPIALMMEAARSSETLVNFYQTTRRYITQKTAIFRGHTDRYMWLDDRVLKIWDR
jgi:hypothetical protein